jgi:hypothetical protein
MGETRLAGFRTPDLEIANPTCASEAGSGFATVRDTFRSATKLQMLERHGPGMA